MDLTYTFTGGLTRPPDPATPDDLTGPPLTLEYRPTLPSAQFWTADGLPRLNVVADIEAMLMHPQVGMALSLYKGAIHGAKFRIKASSSAVGAWAEAELKRFWQNDLETAQTSYDYGWGGFEPCYATDGGTLNLDRLLPVHPKDCRVLLAGGAYVGVRVRGVEGSGAVDLPAASAGPAKAFWYSHRPRYDRWYGRSQLRGAWRPWRRLAARDGAEDVIDAGAYRGAYSGFEVGFPRGTEPSQNDPRAGQTNRDKAREIGQTLKTGGNVQVPTDYYDGGQPKWYVKWPQSLIDLTKLLPWEERLRTLITLGIEVPPEVLEAADTGSGYSGRAIPLQAFFTAQQTNAVVMVRNWKQQLGDPCCRFNFGPDAWFEVEVLPLLETHQQSAQGEAQKPAGEGGPGQAPLQGRGAPTPLEPPEVPGRPARMAIAPDGGTAGDPLPPELSARLATLAEAARAELLDAGPAGVESVLAHYRDQLAGLLAGAMTDAHGLAAASLPGSEDARAADALRQLDPAARELVLTLIDPAAADRLRARFAAEEVGPPEPPTLDLLDAEAADVRTRRPVQRPEFDALTADARARAFTVAGDLHADAIAKVRDAVADQVGGTIDRRAFKKAVEDVPFLDANHLDTVFRQNVQAALSDGLEAALADPLVGDGFPYRAYDATHDGRTGADHLALETAGMDGTNVYRADDPVWAAIRPPWRWKCRCSWRPLSVEQAAALGVQEAVHWLQTGEPPAAPQFVPMPTLDTRGYTRMAIGGAGKPHKYSTTQFNLPPEWAARVLAVAAEIPDEDLADKGRETTPHITVKYGLRAGDPEAVRAVVRGFGPVRVKFGALSLFPAQEGDGFDVLKVAVESDDLCRLNAVLSAALPHVDTQPTYQPHVTLAYLKPGHGETRVGDWPWRDALVEFDALAFNGRDGESTVIPLGRPPASPAAPAADGG